MNKGVGFYGCGSIGKVHIYGYYNLPFYYEPPALNHELIGVCTSSTESAKKNKALYDFEFATTDYKKLLKRNDIDIVHCCTPNNLHKDFIIDAIKADKHIYCEKPLAMNKNEAEEIKKTVEKENYQKKFQMTHQYRYLPATIRAKKLIEEGFLGEVYGFRTQYLHSSYINSDRPISWRLDIEQSGSGALGDLGSHVLDLIYHLLGPYKKVIASQKTFIKERPLPGESGREEVKVDDVTTSLVNLENGGMGTIETWRLATGTEDELRFEIHGSRGALRFNLMKPNWLEIYDAEDEDKPLGGKKGWKKVSTIQRYPEPAADFPGSKLSIGWIRAHVECLHSFLTAIKEDQDTSPSLKEGIYIQKVMGAMEESAKKEKFIKVK